MKRILINAEQPNEVRIAYLEDGKLVDFEIESAAQRSTKGNIYIGVISAVKSDLEGAFVDIGEARHGLLSFSKAGVQGSRDLRSGSNEVELEPQTPNLQVGQKILVQTFREARGEKGAALTTELSIPGRFVVLKPNSRTRAVTRNVSEVQRMRLREVGNKLPNVENVGWIMRTTAVNHTMDEVTGDFNRMMNLWRNIEHAFEQNQHRAPSLVYSDNTTMQRVLRDRLRRDGTKVIVDDPSMYRESRAFASDFMPELRDQIEIYRGGRPIFDAFRVGNDVASSFARKVSLPSGGEVVFDPTEALLSIDVNSAKNTAGANLEETALNTNVEAAREICRQLMIRNIGGLIVVDFIDMVTEGYNEQVEKVVEECLSKDTANSASSKISEFGLMQLNRQRRRPSIYDTHFVECDHCHGCYVPRTETQAHRVLRRLSYLMHDTTRQDNQYLCRVPEDMASFILNKERQYLRDLEINTRKQVVIIADASLNNGGFDIKARHVHGLDFEGGSNLEELLEQSQKDTANRQRADLPAEPQPDPVPLVSPLSDKAPKKKKTKSAKSANASKKKRGKAKPKRTGVLRLIDALLGRKQAKSTKRKQTSNRSAKQGKKKSQAQRKTTKTGNTRTRKTNTGKDNQRTAKPKKKQTVKQNDTKNVRRERPTQKSKQNVPSSARKPQANKNVKREVEKRSSPSAGNANEPKTRGKPTDKVRTAADLKQGADAVAKNEGKTKDSPQQNRRMPRNVRTSGEQQGQTRPQRRSPASGSTREKTANVQSQAKQGNRDDSSSQQPARAQRPMRDPSIQSEENKRAPQNRRSGGRPDQVDARKPTPAPKEPVPSTQEQTQNQPHPQGDQAAPRRQFAANDPRSRQQPAPSGTRRPPASTNGQPEHSETPASTQPKVPARQPTKPPSQAVAEEDASPKTATQESREVSETATLKPAASQEEASRAGNDPRARVGANP